ncbi:MAG TPA: hypothetical protein VD905_20865 [Flavobacteriales bacterium]|nr:hypothetical protein [Flavobacteriales bacterium]
MAEETQYLAKTGMVVMTAANTNLDGTGTLYTVWTAASNGTYIKNVYIKAQTNTTEGMVRLFLNDGGNNNYLLMEINVPAITKSGTNPTFEAVVPLNLSLKSTYVLKASTQNAETFNVISEGLNWAYYASGVRADTTQYTGQFGRCSISTANANLDGTGTLGTAYTAGSFPTYLGSSIRTITLKSTVTVTSGMIRLFIQDGSSNKRLITEIPVPNVTKSGIDEAFEYTIEFPNDFDLQSGYSILASTENAENFRVTVEGMDFNYKA